MTKEERNKKKVKLLADHEFHMKEGKQEIIVKNIKSLYIYAPRGEGAMENIGMHARIPLRLRGLTNAELLVLSYIEIHQFSDKSFNFITKNRKAMPVKLFARVLKLSEMSVSRSLATLIKKNIITKIRDVHKSKNTYFSNMIKKGVEYQMFTLKFIKRADISKSARGFLIRVMMLNTSKLTDVGNIADLSRRVNMSRTSIYKALNELADREFLYDIGEGIFGLNTKFISEEFERREVVETADIMNEIFTKDEEIKMLRTELIKLRRELNILRAENKTMRTYIYNDRVDDEYSGL